MRVKIYPGKVTENLCWIQVSPVEALKLIKSLTNQLLSKNPNDGRLESRCSSDSSVEECSISIDFPPGE
jgi:hypothetical protein